MGGLPVNSNKKLFKSSAALAEPIEEIKNTTAKIDRTIDITKNSYSFVLSNIL
jgi:hypothetical protein